jgi:sulfite exporter TauE/SafE
MSEISLGEPANPAISPVQKTGTTSALAASHIYRLWAVRVAIYFVLGAIAGAVGLILTQSEVSDSGLESFLSGPLAGLSLGYTRLVWRNAETLVSFSARDANAAT